MNTEGEGGEKPHTYGESGVHGPDEHGVNTFREGMNGSNPDEHVHAGVHEEMNTQNGASKGKTGSKGDSVHVFTGSAGEPDHADVKKAVAEIGRSGSGPAKALANYLEGPNRKRLEYLARAVLVARGEDSDGWEQLAPAVKVAASNPDNHPLDCGCEGCL